jgi:hypothetical protein
VVDTFALAGVQRSMLDCRAFALNYVMGIAFDTANSEKGGPDHPMRAKSLEYLRRRMEVRPFDALDASPSSGGVTWVAALVALSVNDLDLGRFLLAEMQRLRSDDVGVTRARAKFELMAKAPVAALGYARKAVEKEPNNEDGRALLKQAEAAVKGHP